MRICSENQVFTTQPGVRLIQFRNAFPQERQGAFAVHFYSYRFIVDEDLAEVVNESIKECLSPVVRIARQCKGKQAVQVVRKNGHSEVEVDFNHNAGTVTVQMEKVNLFRYVSFNQPAFCIPADNIRCPAVKIICHNRGGFDGCSFDKYLP